jgi:xylulokinase
MGVTQSAGLSLRWFRDNFGTRSNDSRDPYDQLSDEAAAVPPGCDGALWTPYLMGERTPHLDPQARAALIGLAANHGRGHIIRAIMEGVAFSLRDSFSIFAEMKVPVTGIRLGGGGARSALWRQIQADVYGHVVEVLQAEEGAAYGAALLAGVGARVWSTVDEACRRSVRVAKQVDPDPATNALMNEQYELYRRIYPALRDIRRNSKSSAVA